MEFEARVVIYFTTLFIIQYKDLLQEWCPVADPGGAQGQTDEK